MTQAFGEFKSAAYPFDPAVPAGQPDELTAPYQPPNPDTYEPPVNQQELEAYRGNFIELILRQVVEAVKGFFSPGEGTALGQLRAWALQIPGLSQVLQLLDGVNALVQGVIDGIVGFVGGGIADVVAWATDVAHDAAQALSGVVKLIGGVGGQVIEDVSHALETAGQGVINIINSIVSGLTGLFGNWTLGDASDALEGHAAAMAAHAAAIAAMQASAQKDNLGAVGITVDLTTLPDSPELPAVFTTTYSGPSGATWGIESGATAWYAAGERLARSRYNGSVTDSDFQLIGAVFSSAPGTHSIFGQFERNARNIIRGRVNAADTHSVEVEFTRRTVLLRCIVGGVEYVFDSAPHTFRPNSAYYLKCGTVGSIRVYQVLQGATSILTYFDVAEISSVGPNYRGGGVGSATAISVLGGVIHPGRVTYFMMADSVPAPTIGSGFKRIRTLSASANADAGIHTFPDNWYNTPERITNDHVYDSVGNKLTVSIEGWYQVIINQDFTTPVVSQWFQIVLWVNGGVYEGADKQGDVHTAQGVFQVYLMPGDYVQPGYSITEGFGGLLKGEETGINTWWSCSLMNRSLA